MVLPQFFWRGRWFWGAWLLVWLLPATREEARLHFVGSRYFSRLYGQPWQERWMTPADTLTPGFSPLEQRVWKSVGDDNDGFNSYSAGPNSNPASTAAGRMLHDFPRESWLRALALRQALSWGSLRGQTAVGKWAAQGEKLDSQNAFYPLILAKILGDGGQKMRREAALRRAAKCSRYDDGASRLKAVALSACRKIGVSTWSEKWQVWSNLDNNGYSSANQLNALLAQLVAVSFQDVAASRKTGSPVRLQTALARSGDMMRVALLFQKAPCDSSLWDTGTNWSRGAWRTGRPDARYFLSPEPTDSEFITFARAQNSAANVQLALQCAARTRLLSKATGPVGGMNRDPMFSTFERLWAEAGGPFGFALLFFLGHLLGWWWFISMLLWRTSGQESPRRARIVPAVFIFVSTLTSFLVLFAVVVTMLNSPTLARRGPPIGQGEVMAAWGLFSFFSPPLLLALWCATRTRFENRAALSLPARQQVEMNLSPLDAWMLSRAIGTFAFALLTLAVGCSILWGYLSWNALTGYDWLRFFFPGASTRVFSPALTSFESVATPLYAALCMVVLAFIWLVSWRYSTDPARRPLFHNGLRAWKESLGCLLTLTVWIYLALVIGCHVSGSVFSKRLDVAAARGEGAFVKGF